jgi:hypothetical protein
MNEIINLIRNILLPYLEQDSRFANNKLNDSFCEDFANAIVRFEIEPNQASELIQSLGLDIENANVNLEEIYNDFLSELAEYFVLGNSNELTAYLITSTNKTFENYVNSFRSIENSIKKTERIRLKLELPQLHDRLVFELPENHITAAIKKKAREELKTKFKKWDDEIKEEKVSETEKPDAKTFAISWFKYAIAACLIITSGLFLYLKNESSTKYSDVVPKQTELNKGYKELLDTNKQNEKSSIIKLEKQILYPSNLGFGPKEKGKVIDIVFIDRNTLKRNEANYTLLNNELVIYQQKQKVEILTIDGKLLYLKIGKHYYDLKATKNILPLKLITNLELIETLDKIIFENE